MKNHYLLLVALVCMTCGSAISAQPIVKQQDIILTSINLRLSQPLILQSVIFTQHVAGTAVVRFDGTCYADSGDRMVMAASNTSQWGINDGNISVQIANANVGCRSFSHTRIYNVAAGTDTFYAVGQNYAEVAGSGLASVYGSLTVEFFPASGPGVPSSNFSWSGSLSGSQQDMNTLVVPVAPLGTAYVHMDGQVNSDPGDRIVLTANNAPSWLVDAGSVAVMANSSTQRISPFVHSRVLDITGNPNSFYAMGANVVDMNGSGNATVYGNISAEFFPDGGATSVAQNDIIFQGLDVRTAAVAMDSIVVSAAHNGKVLVQFDGYITSSPGDVITLAGSNTRHWAANAGCVDVSALSLNNPFNIFSHSRLYSVTPGNHTFYCVAQNYTAQAGLGTIDIDANFSVKYFPDVNTGITESSTEQTFLLFPNPAQNMMTLFFATSGQTQLIEITDMTGRSIISTETSTDQTQINVSALPAGLYLVRCGSTVQRMVKE